LYLVFEDGAYLSCVGSLKGSTYDIYGVAN
jgi:hypothetical protein